MIKFRFPKTSAVKKRDKIRDHSAETNLFLRRIFVAFLGILLLTALLLVTLAHLQIAQFNYYRTRSNENRIKVIPIPPNRGIIYDRNGIPLAINNTVYQLEVIPEKTQSLTAQLQQLKTIIGLTQGEIDTFKSERHQYPGYSSIPLKNKLSQKQIARFMVNQHFFPAFSIVGKQHRYYPYGATFAHAIGYVSKINDSDKARLTEEGKRQYYMGTSNIGKLGIERYYESLLHGYPGYQEVEVNSHGRVIRQLNKTLPKVGQDIYLTLDLKLQQYIEKLLKGQRAAVVAMDPNNGEILALVSSPSYNPNLFVGGISSAEYNKLLNDPDKPLFNRATQGTYPPGSTVKPFLAIAALSTGIITPGTTIYDVGWWQLPNTEKRYRDWKRWGHGNVDVLRSIESSVDTFYYRVAYWLGINRLSAWMRQFGFGEKSGIDLSPNEESRAIMPTRQWKQQRYKQSWLQGDTIPVGIGQGYWTATPVQLVKALSILINQGKVKRPHLLLRVNNNAFVPPHSKINTQSSLLKSVPVRYWQIAQEGMHLVLYGAHGTAQRIFRNMPYQAAGKSGTAQVYGLKTGEIYNNAMVPERLRDHALFIAYAPYLHPKIALAIVLENGGSGSSSGGLIARHILDYYELGDNSIKLDPSILQKNQGN